MNVRAFFIFIAALALLLPLSASASVYLATANTNALSSGLVGYWPFDGNTTNWTTDTTQDVSNNGNTGTLVGMSTTSSPVAGKIGGAFSFNGSNSSYVQVPNITSSSYASNFTVTFWVDPINLAGAAEYTVLGTRLNNTSGWEVGVGGSSGGTCINVFCVVWRTFNGSQFGINSGGSVSYVPVGKWTQITVIQNNGTATIYVNGVFVTQASIANPAQSGTQPLRIAYIGMGSGGSSWNGAIDDVRIYNHVLSAQEVQMLYELGTFSLGNTPASNSSFSIDQVGLNGGLVAYWPLDGNTTSWTTDTTADVSGNGNTGTFVGMSTSTSPVPGKIGQALNFNGSTSYVSTAYTIPSQSSATSFTWSTWAKLGTGNGCCEVIMGFRNGGTWMKLTPTAFEYSSGSIISYSPPTGQWVLLTVVKNGSNFTYYQNGAVVGTASNSSTVVSHTLYLGEDPGNPGDGVFSGSLDDVRIYNRALSVQEVQDLYSAGKVTIDQSSVTSGTGLDSGLVGYWTFNGPSINWRTDTVSDLSGNGGIGTLVGMSTSTSPAPGRTGQALKFNGSSSYVTIPDSTPLNIAGSVTVSAWIYPTTVGVDQKIVGKQNTNNGYKMTLYSNNLIEFELDNGGTSNNIRGNPGGTALTTGRWYFAACTYSTSSGIIACYVNGVLDRSGSFGATALGSSSGVPLEIGTSVKDSQGNIFNGKIDNVRVYNRALSAQEIWQLYSSGM